MKRVVYYQEGLGNWKKRIDEEPFLVYWLWELHVFLEIVLPYRYHQLMRKLGLED